ncbi:MAG: hypothetical protein AAF468_11180 [Pseudomonadota bacterium]
MSYAPGIVVFTFAVFSLAFATMGVSAISGAVAGTGTDGYGVVSTR